LNEPKAMGLPAELENLILLTFAAQTNRAWFRFGSNPHNAAIDDLPDNAELREQALPDEQAWARAIERASALFGLAPSVLRSATNAAKLAQDLGQQVAALLEPARELVRELQPRLSTFTVKPDTSVRLRTAQTGLMLLEALRIATDQERISALANAKLDDQGVNVGTTLKQAQAVVRAIRETHWFLIESASKLPPAGDHLLKRTQDLLQYDELTQPFVVTLKRIIEDAAKLLAEKPTPPPPATPSPVQVPQAPTKNPSPETDTPPVTNSIPLSTGGDSITASGAGASLSLASASSRMHWVGSDDAEVNAFYAGQPDKIARNRQLVRALKDLYRQSQIGGDSTPSGIPPEHLLEVLEVHHIVPLSEGGADERHNMIVVTPTLHALIHADPACTINLSAGEIRLFGCLLPVHVATHHNG
jgi:hypothetical protein